MTTFDFHADFNAGIDFVLDKREEWQDALSRAVIAGNRDFEDYILATQWGGRPGLNIRTGNLYGSLRSAAENLGDKIRAMIWNEKATYWWYHDTVSPQGRSPKRTTIPWSFETYGVKMYESRVADAMQAVFG